MALVIRVYLIPRAVQVTKNCPAGDGTVPDNLLLYRPKSILIEVITKSFEITKIPVVVPAGAENEFPIVIHVVN